LIAGGVELTAGVRHGLGLECGMEQRFEGLAYEEVKPGGVVRKLGVLMGHRKLPTDALTGIIVTLQLCLRNLSLTTHRNRAPPCS